MSREPVRLTDLAELTQAERELLDAGRQLPPVRYDVAAGAAKFHAALEAAAAAGGASAAGGSAATGGLGVGTKLAALLLAAGLGLWGALAMRQTPPAPASAPAVAPVRVEARVGTAAAETGTPAHEAVRPVQTEPEMVRLEPIAEPMPHVKAGTVRLRPAAEKAKRTQPGTVPGPKVGKSEQPADADAVPAPAPPVEEREAATPPAELTTEQPQAPQQVDELRAIARARVLVGRDPGAALALLERVAREHPRGFFVEERRALTVQALAALDRDEAEQRAAEFLRDYPRSPHAARVRAAVDR